MTHNSSNNKIKIAHINICSIRNKICELENIITLNKFHVLAISETHLDSTFDDSSVALIGYNLFHRDRNAYGGGVCIFVQSHIPVKVRTDLMQDSIEAIWIQLHVKHLKPLLIGCCYRPPNTKSVYLENVYQMLDLVTNTSSEVYLLGDLKIDWGSPNCPMKSKLMSAYFWSNTNYK